MIFRAKKRAPSAPFRPTDRDRLDFRLLESGAVALYHKKPVLEAHLGWLREHGWRVHGFDCSRWDSADAMHADLRRGLGFADHYRPTLASLVDALAELDVTEGGAALQLVRYDLFVARERSLAQTLLDVVETTSRGFLLTGRKLLALVQSDDPRIAFERVGARPVNWNPAEWLPADRGVKGATREP
ncbi:MAG: barstar family protein [Gemmatimonadaceae bacterium]